MGVTLIADDVFDVDDGRVRHDYLKTAYLIFQVLMENSGYDHILYI